MFELSGQWQPGGAGEPDGWAKMTGCRPVFYVDSSRNYAADGAEPTETVWHAVGYPGAERSALVSLHKTTGLFPAKFGCGDWVWSHWNDHECRWQILAEYEDHWRFKLLTSLVQCGYATAQLVLYDSGTWCPVPLNFTVHDSLGIVTDFEPAGRYGMAKHFADSCKWELVVLGDGCCDPDTSTSDPPPSESSTSEPPSEGSSGLPPGSDSDSDSSSSSSNSSSGSSSSDSSSSSADSSASASSKSDSSSGSSQSDSGSDGSGSSASQSTSDGSSDSSGSDSLASDSSGSFTNPCPCVMEWDGANWNEVSSCPDNGECEVDACLEPLEPGTFVGEQVASSCPETGPL